MRDLPNIVRVAIVMLLLASLLIILRQLGSEDGSGTPGALSPAAKKEVAVVLSQETEFYPAVPSPLPDLNDGYLFNQERNLEESDLEDGDSGPGDDAIDMEEVVYSGSIIIGDLRKALVAYQEKVPAPQMGSRRNVRGRNIKQPAKGSFKHKQLNAGEIFNGYKVAVIEDFRIVFEKGGERIEKFLFDASKERVEIKSSSVPETPSPTALQNAVEAAVPGMEKPSIPQVPQNIRVPGQPPPGEIERPTRTRPVRNTDPVAPSPGIRSRRSQRLLGLDPSFVPPTPPEEAK